MRLPRLLPLLLATALLAGCGQAADADYLPATAAPSTVPAAEPPAAAADAAPPVAQADILAKLSPETVSVKGAADAPLLIIEFSDYQCPFCGRYVSQTLPQIQAQYIDTGKVRYMFRDMPLSSIHPQAQAAAEAARCAGDQGRYWEMHELLFARQEDWTADRRGSFAAFADELSLDATKFSGCLDEGRYTAYVKAQIAEGEQLGIRGTPSFLIGDQFLSGAQPFSAFQQAIEAALAAK